METHEWTASAGGMRGPYRRDDDLLGATSKVCGSGLGAGEHASGFADVVGTNRAPGDVLGRLGVEHVHLLAVDDQLACAAQHTHMHTAYK